MSREFLLVVGLCTANTGFFLGMTTFYLKHAHHHWIVPVFCGLLFLESYLLTQFPISWPVDLGRATLLGWVFVAAGLLFWRQFSMFVCFQHCEWRLAGGLLALALACAVLAKGALSTRLRKTAGFSAGVVFLWTGTVAAAGLFPGAFGLQALIGYCRFAP